MTEEEEGTVKEKEEHRRERERKTLPAINPIPLLELGDALADLDNFPRGVTADDDRPRLDESTAHLHICVAVFARHSLVRRKDL